MPPTELTASSVLIDILLIIGWMTAFVIILALAFFVVGWLFWTLSHLLPRVLRERIGRLFRHVYYDIFDGAWKLAALGSAALALTAASAFTTWGGLRSFTEHDANGKSTLVGLSLAFAIAFGIQSVMLIAAWNIGDTYAAALPVRASNADARRRAIESRVGIALGILLASLMVVWVRGALVLPETAVADELGHRLTIIAETFVSVAVLIVAAYSLRGNEFIGPYLRGLGIIIKNAVIWVMFIAAMTVSVFFSFDYHFNAIFNEKLRQTTADARAQQKLSVVTTYLGERLPGRVKEMQQALFKGRAWTDYEPQLEVARKIAEQSPERQRQINQAEQAARQAKIAELDTAATTLNSQIRPLELQSSAFNAQLKSKQGQLAQKRKEFDEQTGQFEDARKELDETKARAKLEAGGVGGDGRTGHEGQGPAYRAAMKAAGEAQIKFNVAQDKWNSTKQDADRLENEVTGILSQLAAIDPKLTDLRNKAATTTQALQDEKKIEASRPDDPSAIRRALDGDVAQFRRDPGKESLDAIQAGCNRLKTIGGNVGDTNAGSLNCDTKELNEALTAFNAEKTRVNDLLPSCTSGSAIAGKGVDAMINLAQSCLQDSRLPPVELADYQQMVREMREIRDDTAQSFQRTINAYHDRNSLAGLALAIAITVDSLIFFAGVFAAMTMTSPLEKAGLRDLAKQVRQMPPRDVRWALGEMRDHAFAKAQCDDPRVNTIVTLGLDRQIPTQPEGTLLVESQRDAESVRYVLHQIYRDELHEIVRKAERRGELDPEPEQSPGSSGSAGPRNERVVVFAPRPSAGRSA
jgi:hypothetical protein